MNIKNRNGIMYTFHSGDSLYAISRRYNVSIAEISRDNPLIDIYNLQVGDEIYLPVDFRLKKKVIVYIVNKNETIQNVLVKFHLNLEELLKYNELESLSLKEGMQLYIPMIDYEVDESST